MSFLLFVLVSVGPVVLLFTGPVVFTDPVPVVTGPVVLADPVPVVTGPVILADPVPVVTGSVVFAVPVTGAVVVPVVFTVVVGFV